jgi:Zn-dependent protease with chaperone function
MALPEGLPDVVRALGIAGRVDLIAEVGPFALTVGLWRPRIMVSTGLLSTLSAAELAAVLVHERCHLRRRDPLRLLATGLLAGYGVILPLSAHLADRAALRRELAADRDALTHAGRGAVAGALLKLADTTLRPHTRAASLAMGARRDPAGSLHARIAQLEDGRPPRRRLARLGLAVTTGNLALVAAASLCCVGLSQALPGGIA